MSDIDIIGSFSAEPTITGQLETTLVIQGNVDSQFPAQVSVVSTTTGDPGTDASVVNAGTPGNARLKFTIPRGPDGTPGAPGTDGEDGLIQSIVAGSNITVDNSDPANPIINSTASGNGDVVGPASATDGRLAAFDTATGKLLKDSGKAVSDFATAAQGVKADGAVQDIAATVHAATGKSTPVDADEFALVDSAASNVLKKFTWSNLKAALASTFLTWAPVRERLSANRTYYVRKDGSDGNNGLADTSGGAFLTIPKAISSALNLDLNGFDVTVQVGSGTYTDAIAVTSAQVGAGNIKLKGDTTTPSNVVIATVNATNITVSGGGAKLSIEGFKFTNSGGSSIAQVYSNAGALVTITGKCEFGTADFYHIISEANATVTIANVSYIISGGGACHWLATTAGVIISSGCTWTLSGTPAFSEAFCHARTGALVSTAGNAVGSGSATGKRYLSDANSVINTFGSGASYFPGDTAGTTATGGQYV